MPQVCCDYSSPPPVDLSLSDPEAAPLQSTDTNRSRKQVVMDTGVHWTRLRSCLLSALINLASQTGDIMQTIKYLIYMLREVVPEDIQLNHDQAATLGGSSLESSVYGQSSTGSRLDTLRETFGIGTSHFMSTVSSAIPTKAALVNASSSDSDYIQLLRDKAAQIPPVFFHSATPVVYKNGLGIAGGVLPVVFVCHSFYFRFLTPIDA